MGAEAGVVRHHLEEEGAGAEVVEVVEAVQIRDYSVGVAVGAQAEGQVFQAGVAGVVVEAQLAEQREEAAQEAQAGEAAQVEQLKQGAKVVRAVREAGEAALLGHVKAAEVVRVDVQLAWVWHLKDDVTEGHETVGAGEQ